MQEGCSYVFMEIEISNAMEVEDLYRDGRYLKTVLVQGLSTEKA